MSINLASLIVFLASRSFPIVSLNIIDELALMMRDGYLMMIRFGSVFKIQDGYDFSFLLKFFSNLLMFNRLSFLYLACMVALSVPLLFPISISLFFICERRVDFVFAFQFEPSNLCPILLICFPLGLLGIVKMSLGRTILGFRFPNCDPFSYEKTRDE